VSGFQDGLVYDDMKYLYRETTAKAGSLLLALSMTIGCASSNTESPSPEEILSRMRADTAWICRLDSLAGIAIGPGAKCIDPVQHTFSYDGRTWFFNEDWGGVLEIPSDYLPQDDLQQTELSFHGTRAVSPDSTVSVSFQAGFLPVEFDRFCEALLGEMGNDGVETVRDDRGGTLSLRGRGGEGTRFWARHVSSGTDRVLFSALVQYADGRDAEAERVIGMAGRYPEGPSGTLFKGLCLQDISVDHVE
jgi:hypothetical protein